MASFSQKIENKYGTATYQDTKNTYDWIIKAVQKIGFSRIKTTFSFSASEISYHCDSIEEFVTHAYGQAEYDFTSMYFTIISESEDMWFISTDFDNKLRISTESKNLLEIAVASLKNTILNQSEINDSVSIVYVNQQHVETLVGGNNIVANDHSSVVTGNNNSIGQSDKETPIKQWIKAIGQNLISNGVWYILCILGGIIIAYLAT